MAYLWDYYAHEYIIYVRSSANVNGINYNSRILLLGQKCFEARGCLRQRVKIQVINYRYSQIITYINISELHLNNAIFQHSLTIGFYIKFKVFLMNESFQMTCLTIKIAFKTRRETRRVYWFWKDDVFFLFYILY